MLNRKDFYPAQLSSVAAARGDSRARWRWSRTSCSLMNPPQRWILNWSGEVLKVMRSGGGGRTMLVVTHELGFARHVLQPGGLYAPGDD